MLELLGQSNPWPLDWRTMTRLGETELFETEGSFVVESDKMLPKLFIQRKHWRFKDCFWQREIAPYLKALNSKDHSGFGEFWSLPQPPLVAYLSSSKLSDNRVSWDKATSHHLRYCQHDVTDYYFQTSFPCVHQPRYYLLSGFLRIYHVVLL